MIPAAASADQHARDRIRNSLSESLVVEASAGTGKTTELVARIVNTLKTGVTGIERIVAVTFTNKAAGELKLRIRQGLDRARSAANSEERRHLEEALAQLEEASIGTIHSFCAQILRERPVEAGVDPAFQELTDPEAKRLFAQVFQRWLEAKLNADSPGLRRAMARLAVERDRAFTPLEQLRFAAWQLIEWRDFPAPWQRMPMPPHEVVDALCDAIGKLDLKRFKSELTEPVRDMLPWIEREPRDRDMLEALLLRLHKQWKRVAGKGRVPDEAIFRCIGDFRHAAEADLAAQLREELWELVPLYDDAKRRAGKLDFLDLLLLVRNLVRDNHEVRRYLQRRYTHLLIDEFQDTDPLQAEILLLLSSADPAASDWLAVTPAPGKLFLVGDPKQSIYKFRRADLRLYQSLLERLESRGVSILRLSKSFRAVRTIQDCVNAAFAEELNGDAESAQAHSVELEEHRPDIEGQPAVVALPAPEPYGSRNITKKAIEECLPGAVTAFIDWTLTSSKWRIEDPETRELIPVRARDICVLFRRFTNFGQDLTRGYVRSLEDRGIPHLLVGSKSFHWREEIETLRAALTAVEWPEDELAVYATLRGALFAIQDSTLLRWRQEIGPLHPFRALPESPAAPLQPVAEALTILRDLHLHRNRRPIAQTVYLLGESTRAWAAFALRPAGHQALANVRRVVDLARQFETGGGLSFRGFIDELNAHAERAESAEAPVLEEGADGVRLMTVHTAKGLEFPVVILADMTANIAHENPDRYVEAQTGISAARLLGCLPKDLLDHEASERRRERAEGVRVAYVAATRARDILVVPVVGDEERQGWLEPLNKAVYPPLTHSRQARQPPGCPEFGRVSVLNRPPEYRDESSVEPGLHQARKGGHPVVWWDPAALPPSQEERFGERQEEILAEDAPALERSLAAYDAWLASRSRIIEEGSRATLAIATAAESTAPPEGYTGFVLVESAARAAHRPAGKRFGMLVHAVLRDVSLTAGSAELEAVAKMHGRLLAAPKSEADAAARAAGAALRHPLLERARAAARCYREYPVLLRLEDNKAVEGVIDLAFEEDGRWVVVDFKTDADGTARLDAYRAQAAWYGFALERITGKQAECFLLRV